MEKKAKKGENIKDIVKYLTICKCKHIHDTYAYVHMHIYIYIKHIIGTIG